MALTNNLKKQIDLPVWEYCRFAPQITTNVSSLTTGNSLGNQFLYYQVSNLLYRYDTVSDSWMQLSSTPTNTPTIMNNNVLSNSVGHYGQAISGGVKTIQLAGLSGNILVGYKIRIISGTGSGQERTIVSVDNPVTHDRGVATTASSTTIPDATTGIGLKQWKTNIWKNYQVRIDYGSGRTQVRPILYNTINTLVFSDVNHITINPWAQCPLMVATVASTSFYVIESHQVTVNSNWDVIPDSTSNFCIMSGGMWNVSQGTTGAPFFTLMYYDLLSDVWYQKSTQSGLKTSVFLAASDLSMERYTETGGYLLSGSTTSAGNRYTNVSETLIPMDLANYEIRIVSGTAIGQSRTILSNTTSKINVTRDWEINPDSTSKYEIWMGVGKLMMIGGNDAGMLQYSQVRDQWTTGKQFDDGQCNQLSATRFGQEPISLTSITRTTTSMVSGGTISDGGTGYNVDDILTVDAKGGTLRVLTINPANGAVLTTSLETCGTGYVAGASKATTVLPAGGINCTITLGASDIDFTELAVTVIAHNFKIDDIVTINGATSTGAAKFNGTYKIIGNSTNNLSFSYCSVGDPGNATAIILASPSTVQVVDSSKNWTINEHVGKLVQLSTNAVYSVGQVRRIVSNTATTLVWTLAATAPVNGTTKYVIFDNKPFGTDVTQGGQIGGGTEGFATGGSTTTIIDTTKNWPTNFWSRTAQRKVRIVEGVGVGSELSITSNTNNTLTFATQDFTVDTTTRYVIMDTFGTATAAGTTTTLTDTSQNWTVNQWVGKRVRFMSGTSQGNEYTITTNTLNVLTFAAGTAPDTSTAYAILEATPKAYGIHLDCIINSSNTKLNSKYLYAWTGTATPELSRYNINTEHWELLSYFPQFETFTSGTMYCYDGHDRIYISASTAFAGGITGRILYYDLVKNCIVNSSTPPYGHSTIITGNRMEIIETDDNLKYLYMMRHTGQEMWRTLLFW